MAMDQAVDDRPEESVCQECQGERWVYINVPNHSDGSESGQVMGWVPCFRCNPRGEIPNKRY